MPKQTPTPPSPNLLKERLITKENYQLIPQRGTLSKCALRFRDYLHAYHSLTAATKTNNNNNSISNGSNTTDTTADDTTNNNTDKSNTLQLLQQNLTNAHHELITELKLHDLEMRKVSLTSNAIMNELQYYKTLHDDTKENILQIRKEIEQLKEKLQHEQKVKHNREEYELHAKMAMKRPPVCETKRKLEEVKSDITELEEKKRRNSDNIEMKRKQFQCLMQTIFDLKHGLEEDDIRKDIERNVNNDDKQETEDLIENLYGDLSSTK